MIRRMLGRLRPTVGEPPQLDPIEAYDRWARTYGVEPNALQRLEDDALEAVLPPLSGRHFLDVGAGKGRLAARALHGAASAAVAVEPSAAMLASWGRDPDPSPRRVRARAEHLPFLDATFDAVGSALMLGHLPAPATALSEMRRVLRAGGPIIVTDFHPHAARRGWLRSFTDPYSGRPVAARHYPYDLEVLLGALDAVGFTLEALQERRFAGHPVVFALRARLAGGPATAGKDA